MDTIMPTSTVSLFFLAAFLFSFRAIATGSLIPISIVSR